MVESTGMEACILDLIVTSTKNPTIKEIRKLQKRHHREASGFCYVEGIQPVLRAIENGMHIELLVYAPELLKSDVAMATLKTLQERNIRTLAVHSDVFEDISDRDNPVGIAAVVKPRYRELQQLEAGNSSILTALHDVKNPGNLGTIIRTIDSVAGHGIVLMGQTADPYDPACIKASMGTVFNIPVVKVSDPEDFLKWCKQKSVSLITTSAKAKHLVADAAFTYPCAVMLGSEAQGLPPKLLDAGDLPVRIPMYGQASSLNLAVAAGIILYEVKKGMSQRAGGLQTPSPV